MFASAVVVMSMAFLAGSCDGEPCGLTSDPALTALSAWFGLVGLIAALVLAHFRLRRTTAAIVLVTLAFYAAWLVFFLREIDESPQDPVSTGFWNKGEGPNVALRRVLPGARQCWLARSEHEAG